MSVVYILAEFPSYSEYFILNEMIELQKKGVELKVFAVRKGPDMGGRVQDFTGSAIFSSPIFSICSMQAHLYLLNNFGWNYLNTLENILIKSKWSLYDFFKGFKNFTIGAQFLFKLRKNKINHMHAHFVSFPASIALLISQLSGISFSCSAHAHDIYTSDRIELARKLDAAKFFVTCTSFNKRFLDSMVNRKRKEKIVHVYHGIDLSQWPQRQKRSIVNKEFQVLSIGRLVEKKGIIFLLEAVKLLRDRGFRLKCSIIGEGPLRGFFEDFVKRNDLEKFISFPGALEQGTVKKYLQEADVFVLPSTVMPNGDKDGLPNVLLEALAIGVPVVSTPVSAIPELIISGQTGILIPDKDSEGIANAVEELARKPSLCDFLVQNGRRKVELDFSIETSTHQLLKLLNHSEEHEEKQTA